MKLIYRTRGGSSPRGKSRVYFTGHPADMSVCFEEVCADILEIQNCAIYYDEEPEAPYDAEELLHELEQMQLIVIPVTERFLCQESRALAVELPFALERHIPVLPLAREANLEAAFNEKCGDLQMLNKNDPDPTALPYAEKLKKFLSSVLVGDELAEKVRAAFDAYIFLSYRKKDRRYARELMQLIHKNKFCRDIAIWYDEFLTPGEDFNEAIAGALQKCSLFTLAVTPNIMEPGNYVMKQEYPEAKKSGKPILPMELVPTDKAALERSFEDIPPCTDAHDENTLSDTLLRAVQKLAIQENDGSPEHIFFIGLAYLNGIDVEVDRPRALSLITGAAESGLPEAMEKLVSMYQNGDGVKRDYRTAIQWQERLVDWRRKRFEESRAEEDALYLANALWDLGDCQSKASAAAAAKQTYEQMLELCRQFAELYGGSRTSWWAWKYVSDCYGFLGNSCLWEGDLEGAKAYYWQSVEIVQALQGKTGGLDMRRDLVACHTNLGNISRAEGKWKEAKYYYQQALALDKQLYEELGTAKERRELFVSYSNLGIVSQEEAELTDAKEFYQEALKLSRQGYEETGTEEAGEDLATAYIQLGNLSERESRFSEAKDYYMQGLELYRQLWEETGALGAKRELSLSYNRLGLVSRNEGKLSEAESYFAQALKLRRELYEETGTILARRDLAGSCEKLGTLREEMLELGEAKRLYLEALMLRKQLYEETKTRQLQKELSCTYEMLRELSDSYKKQCMSELNEGKSVRARELYLQDLELNRLLYEETKTKEAQRELLVCCRNLGDISQAVNEPAAAEDYYRQELELSRQLCEEKETRQARRDLSVSYNKMGEISWKKGRLAEAKDYYRKALEQNGLVWEEEEEERKEPSAWLLRSGQARKEDRETQRSLTETYTGLIRLAQAEGSWNQAKEYFLRSLKVSEPLHEKVTTIATPESVYIRDRELALLKDSYLLGLEINKRLYEESGDTEARMGLADSYDRLGSVCQKQKDFDEAEACYRQSLRLSEQWGEEAGGEEAGSEDARQRLAASHTRLGDALQAGGKLAESKEQYLRGWEIRKQLCEEAGTYQAQQYLRLALDRLGVLAHRYDGRGKKCENEGDLAQAEQFYLQNMELNRLVNRELWCEENWQDSAAEQGLLHDRGFIRMRSEVSHNLWAAYSKLGRVAAAAGRPDRAKEYYLSGIRENKLWYERGGAALAQRLTATSYKKLAEISRLEGNLAEAAEYERQADDFA